VTYLNGRMTGCSPISSPDGKGLVQRLEGTTSDYLAAVEPTMAVAAKHRAGTGIVGLNVHV
jgi:hypothetical protein